MINELFEADVLAAIFIGYLFGSVPFGLILTRIFLKKDVRSLGSGNIGATNVLRTGSKKLGALTLILDTLKGALAFLIIVTNFGSIPALAGGIAAILGHCFPLWLRFKGGKGVAVFFGLCWAIAWPFGVVFTSFWLLTAKITRYSSLGALIACITVSALSVYFLFYGALALFPTDYLSLLPAKAYPFTLRHGALFFVPATFIVIIKHHANIKRLMKGTENRIGA